MVEDIFSGLLEGLVEVVFEALGEIAGEVLNGIGDWFSGGGARRNEREAAAVIEKYRFLPKDSDG